MTALCAYCNGKHKCANDACPVITLQLFNIGFLREDNELLKVRLACMRADIPTDKITVNFNVTKKIVDRRTIGASVTIDKSSGKTLVSGSNSHVIGSDSHSNAQGDSVAASGGSTGHRVGSPPTDNDFTKDFVEVVDAVLNRQQDLETRLAALAQSTDTSEVWRYLANMRSERDAQAVATKAHELGPGAQNVLKTIASELTKGVTAAAISAAVKHFGG